MTPSRFAQLPEPPYYAVIFSSQRSDDAQGYGDMIEQMMNLAAEQPGFLGVESTRDAQGFGMTVSYWADSESITAWRKNAQHRVAQDQGRARWYEHFETRVAKVERASSK